MIPTGMLVEGFGKGLAVGILAEGLGNELYK